MLKTNLTVLLALGSITFATVACDVEEDGNEEELVADGEEPADSDGDDEEPADSDGEDEDDDDEDPADSDGDEAPLEDQCAEGSSQACGLEGGGDGIQYCDTIGGEDALQWGPCIDGSFYCVPGEQDSCGFCDGLSDEECENNGFGGEWYFQCRLNDGIPGGGEDECNTPLVLSFDGGAVQMTDAGAETFDINAAGGCMTTDWPTSATPWLALDLDRSGSIESGRELFGSGTRLAAGQRARNGFAALAELDTNGDGRISGGDERFSELVLWSDHDGDRTATFSELEGLGPRGILSIELGYEVDPRCDARGNCENQRASFTFIDRFGAVRDGEVVDLYLACQ
ncbi:MAG: calcium-binding protein [Myxococcota bacterium]